MKELLGYFLEGLHDSDLIQNMYQKAYRGLFVYGFEEALDGPYKQHNLDIYKVEEWPAEKINWVPEELKEKLVHPLRETFSRFRINLERGGSNQHCPFLSL
jgi:hypothetical protein